MALQNLDDVNKTANSHKTFLDKLQRCFDDRTQVLNEYTKGHHDFLQMVEDLKNGARE